MLMLVCSLGVKRLNNDLNMGQIWKKIDCSELLNKLLNQVDAFTTAFNPNNLALLRVTITIED